MGKLIQRAAEFTGQLDATVRNIDMLGEGDTHGLPAAAARMDQAMLELGIDLRQNGIEEPISHSQACETAERLYHALVKQAKKHENHTTFRLAQAVNLAWAELTVSDGLTEAWR